MFIIIEMTFMVFMSDNNYLASLNTRNEDVMTQMFVLPTRCRLTSDKHARNRYRLVRRLQMDDIMTRI